MLRLGKSNFQVCDVSVGSVLAQISESGSEIQTTQFSKGRLSKFSARTRRLVREATEQPKKDHFWRFSSREY